MESGMNRGRVKWFEQSKGYGYIEQENGQDVFVHFTTIQDERFQSLDEGTEVEFEAVKGEKGLRAKKVIKLKK